MNSVPIYVIVKNNNDIQILICSNNTIYLLTYTRISTLNKLNKFFYYYYYNSITIIL